MEAAYACESGGRATRESGRHATLRSGSKPTLRVWELVRQLQQQLRTERVWWVGHGPTPIDTPSSGPPLAPLPPSRPLPPPPTPAPPGRTHAGARVGPPARTGARGPPACAAGRTRWRGTAPPRPLRRRAAGRGRPWRQIRGDDAAAGTRRSGGATNWRVAAPRRVFDAGTRRVRGLHAAARVRWRQVDGAFRRLKPPHPLGTVFEARGSTLSRLSVGAVRCLRGCS